MKSLNIKILSVTAAGLFFYGLGFFIKPESSELSSALPALEQVSFSTTQKITSNTPNLSRAVKTARAPSERQTANGINSFAEFWRAYPKVSVGDVHRLMGGFEPDQLSLQEMFENIDQNDA